MLMQVKASPEVKQAHKDSMEKAFSAIFLELAPVQQRKVILAKSPQDIFNILDAEYLSKEATFFSSSSKKDKSKQPGPC